MLHKWSDLLTQWTSARPSCVPAPEADLIQGTSGAVTFKRPSRRPQSMTQQPLARQSPTAIRHEMFFGHWMPVQHYRR